MTTDTMALNALQKAFPGIPDLEADQLLVAGEVVQYLPGKVLCNEGVVENIFYILLEGKVKVSKIINEQEHRFLKHLIPGDFFGEMGIIHDAPRAASVATTENSTVLEISREAFERALDESATVSKAMVREVSRRLRENDEMAVEDLRIKAGELAEAYQQLAELELARSEFLTTVAHELRTPLTSAAGFVQVIRMGKMDEDTLNSTLDVVARNIDQITNLINDILFLQEMDLILAEFEPVDLGALIQKVIESEREHAFGNRVVFSKSVTPDLPPLLGDPNSLERAFSAIINNAVKFSPDGGEVRVEIGHNPFNIWVRVTDEGIGIHADDLEKIFDRFQRTDEFDGHLFGGLGLGLSITRQVIEQHRGDIDVHSHLRNGSVFTVRFKLGVQPEQSNGSDN